MIFEYQCTNPYCREVTEKLILNAKEAHQTVWCEACGSRAERIMSASNGVVKGKYTAKTRYAYAAQNKPLGEMR